ncbi:hypothetical protein [Natronococcus sp. A-GB7]|uniref:hypothetical protein n=1 Tax=Natronococcus sp. A-GB7 TaxID=3037649 RepID=UPI00241F8305|nr:hypothetical protein [Natronococcus sp. A-GB7]MDG5821894.1 hypothetical protein [Natronococcus sp. A-GB7]
MPRITFTAEESHKNHLADLEERDNIDSTAAAVRHCIEIAAEAQQNDAELQRCIEELQREVERLKNEKRTLIEDRQEKQELVRYVEEERKIQRMRQERESAPVWRRAKWWVLGAPTNGRD